MMVWLSYVLRGESVILMSGERKEGKRDKEGGRGSRRAKMREAHQDSMNSGSIETVSERKKTRTSKEREKSERIMI
jgi:hypothetical protein